MGNCFSGNWESRANNEEVNAASVTISPESRAEGESESERISVDLDVEIPQNKIEVYLSFHCATPEVKLSEQLVELPCCVSLLKENIESKFSIPACCQEIFFNSTMLHDSQSLPLPYMRHDDTIEVHYRCTADVEDIRNVMKQLQDAETCLVSLQPFLSKNRYCVGTDDYSKLRDILNLQGVESLYKRYFNCHPDNTDKNREANLLYFLHSNGLTLLCSLHTLLLTQQWSPSHLYFCYLENVLMRIFWDISNECYEFGIQISLDSVVSNISRSCLRSTFSVDENSQSERELISGFSLNSTIYFAAGVLCKYALCCCPMYHPHALIY